MNERPNLGATPSRSQPAHHRVARGAPSYRPVRSPLVSMGPSLSEERRRRHAYRRGLALAVAAMAVAAGLGWLVLLLGREVISAPPATAPVAPPALPLGSPDPQSLAGVQAADASGEPAMKLQVPVNRGAVTAIGYDRVGDFRLLALDPEGERANLSFGQRLARRFMATEQPTALRFYMLGDHGNVNVINVGARPGTDVYAPVSGIVVAIADNVIDDEPQGVTVSIQPLGDTETLVVLRFLDPARQLAVGQTVSEGTTRIGFVRDMGDGVRHPLARYTHDDGSNVEMRVRHVRPELLP